MLTLTGIIIEVNYHAVTAYLAAVHPLAAVDKDAWQSQCISNFQTYPLPQCNGGSNGGALGARAPPFEFPCGCTGLLIAQKWAKMAPI